jgi:hypothetical protein
MLTPGPGADEADNAVGVRPSGQRTYTTVSQISSFVERLAAPATWASLQGRDNRDRQQAMDGGDQVRDVARGPDRERLGVDRGSRQKPGMANATGVQFADPLRFH